MSYAELTQGATSIRGSNRPRRVMSRPVAFAVTRRDRTAEEWVTISRPAAEKLISFAKQLKLHYLPTIELHGVSRLKSRNVQGLEKDLRIVGDRTNDQTLQAAVLLLLPLAERIDLDPKLILLIEAGQ